MTRPDQIDLFDATMLTLEPGALVLRGFAADAAPALLGEIDFIAQAAPWRQMETVRGRMSVAMTNCGRVGWISDRRGYRYDAIDPSTQRAWPPLPDLFAGVAARAAQTAGYADFAPDACLINRYEPGAKLALHQDRNEQDYTAPIVSVSLGLPATFLWGGSTRSDRTQRVRLEHGDVVVWGGAARLRFHGIDALRDDVHALTGRFRFNLTLRRAL